MSQPEAPKIEFPCQYPIKILGRQCDHFETTIFDIVESHAPGFCRETINRKVSREGTFCSYTVTITATGEAQLSAMHQALMDSGLVNMVI
jgi:putative lipoic acid-binding regulatory protein